MVYLSEPTPYRDGVQVASYVTGTLSNSNRVMRYKFRTGSFSVARISISVPTMTITKPEGSPEDCTQIPFSVTPTTDESYCNATYPAFSSVSQGFITKDGQTNGAAYFGSIQFGSGEELLPNTDYYIWFYPISSVNGYVFWSTNKTITASLEGASVTPHTLTISQGEHSTVQVSRMRSDYAPLGNLSSGALVYNGDNLRISFAVDEGYTLDTHTVNGSTFANASIYVVSGNVFVVSSAEQAGATINATNVVMSSLPEDQTVLTGVSHVTVTKQNPRYYHTIEYSVSELSGQVRGGYIGENGEVSNTPFRFRNSEVDFIIPQSFCESMINSSSVTVTLSCKVYKQDSSINDIENMRCSCTFIVRVPISLLAPTVECTVWDVNESTVAHTGDSSILVRSLSTARCTISATAEYGAYIQTIYINGDKNTIGGTNTSIQIYADFENVSVSTYSIRVVDSRGGTAIQIVECEMKEYIPPTCNPVVSRAPSTSGLDGADQMLVSAEGKFYNASFGLHSNALQVSCRWREIGDTGPWSSQSIAVFPEGNTGIVGIEYSIPPTVLNDEFNHSVGYEFEIIAFDGSVCELSEVIKTCTVTSAVPIFDWGRNDFNINGILNIFGKNIFDLIYPVGTVYYAALPNLPDSIASIGNWIALNVSAGEINGWKRTS